MKFYIQTLCASIFAASATLGNAAEDIPTVAAENGSFNTLVDALTAANLVDTLKGDGPFTVFAPTDGAFAALPAGTLDCLLKEENKQALTNVLLYHVADGNVPSSALTDEQMIQTKLDGAKVEVDLSNGVKINEATVTTPNVEASNGVIHIIDQVLVPSTLDVCLGLADIPTTATNAGFDTLVTALSAAELVPTLSGPGPFTVFAPTDDAFAALPQGTLDCLLKTENKQALTDVLLYHVADGNVAASDLSDGQMIQTKLGGAKVEVDLSNGVKINEATVTSPNVFTSNGIIHIIDQVLVPSSLTVCVGLVDIPTTATNAGFDTLVTALSAAELVPTLSGPGPFTVFAPTDDAFAALPQGTLDCLLKTENKQALTDVLLYHVADGNVAASQLSDGQMIQTKLDGAKVEVDLSKGVKINEATVTSPNVFTSNGIIHIIDQVLVPSSLTVCVGLVDIPTTAINANFTTLVAALSAAELVPTLSGPGPFTVFAPTDDAFDALPDGTLSCLLEEENKQALTDILLYHVADGSVAASDLSDGQMIQTKLDGAKVEVDLSSGVKINEAAVTSPNVFTTNGIIHIIDQVLVPSSVHDCVHSHDDDDDSSTDKKSLRLMYSVVIAGVALLFTAV